MKGWSASAGRASEEGMPAEERAKWAGLRREIGTEPEGVDEVAEALIRQELAALYEIHPEWEKKIGPTKGDVLMAARLVAEELGEAMTFQDFLKRTRITFSQVKDYFGGWSGLREALGMSHRARPAKRGPTDVEIRDALMDLMAEVENPSWEEFRQATGWSQRTVADRWGSWLALKESVGLGAVVRKSGGPTKGEMLSAFQEMAANGDGWVTQRAFCAATGWNNGTVARRWGSFTELRRAGGGAETRGGASSVTDEELVADVRRVWREVGGRAGHGGRKGAAAGDGSRCEEVEGGRRGWITGETYERCGRWSLTTVRRRLGCWEEVRRRVVEG